MVYSTCSLNPIENEAVIASLLEKSQGEIKSNIFPTVQLKKKKKKVDDSTSNKLSVGNVLLVCKTAAYFLVLDFIVFYMSSLPERE